KFEGAFNYHIAVQETSEGIVFLRKILRGGTDKSYGIHVAKLAGLPLDVLKIATSTLKELENKSKRQKPLKQRPEQPSLFDEPHPVVKAIKDLDINQLTPLQALLLLEKWRLLC
ncbi:MAG: DNA mismatch repair protein MutS, partial [Chlamydiae bacterium]|nr:DNA mismatch repair protein MutS [Chlamydiota bacterium]